jgi:hypothetical protein
LTIEKAKGKSEANRPDKNVSIDYQKSFEFIEF